jgi:serine/threonine-protein kinase
VQETTAPLVGQIIGEYEILKLLKKTELAFVYQAHQPSQDRLVALRLLPPHLSRGGMAARLAQEVDIAARLEHPHILGADAYGEYEGMAYVVMPYIEGGTLQERLRATPPPSRKWALARLLEICDALAYAHEQGVVHRDVKPSNILLRDEHWAMLSDFGISRSMEGAGLTAVGAVLGTPEYMAPEQGQGLSVDHRADVYAAGIVLYRILAGELPFRGKSAVQVMMQHLQAPVPTLPVSDDGSSEAWNAVLARALAKSPDARYQSVDELRQAIKDAMAKDSSLDAEPVAPPIAGTASPGAGASETSRASSDAAPVPVAMSAQSGAKGELAQPSLLRRLFGWLPFVR